MVIQKYTNSFSVSMEHVLLGTRTPANSTDWKFHGRCRVWSLMANQKVVGAPKAPKSTSMLAKRTKELMRSVCGFLWCSVLVGGFLGCVLMKDDSYWSGLAMSTTPRGHPYHMPVSCAPWHTYQRLHWAPVSHAFLFCYYRFVLLFIFCFSLKLFLFSLFLISTFCFCFFFIRFF